MKQKTATYFMLFSLVILAILVGFFAGSAGIHHTSINWADSVKSATVDSVNEFSTDE